MRSRSILRTLALCLTSLLSATVAHADVYRGGADRPMRPVHDARSGWVAFMLPLPRTWTVHAPSSGRGASISGPRGVQVRFDSLQATARSRRAGKKATGAQLSSGVADVLADLAPWAAQRGYRLKSVSTVAAARSSRQQRGQAYATEWLDAAGKRHFVGVTVQDGEAGRSYSLLTLDANAASFEDAKQHLIYALQNTWYNPRFLADGRAVVAAR